jgi:hypothetical protein
VTVAEQIRKALLRSDTEQRPEGKKIKANSYYYKGRGKILVHPAKKQPPSHPEGRQRSERTKKRTQRIRQHADNIQAIANGVNHDIPTRDDGVDSAEPPDNIEDRWNEVVRRGHCRRAQFRGSRQAEDTNLKAAEKTAWLYVIYQTTEKNLMKFLRDSEITGEIVCDQLDTKCINMAI